MNILWTLKFLARNYFIKDYLTYFIFGQTTIFKQKVDQYKKHHNYYLFVFIYY